MEELLGSLRSLFETERELIEEGRAIDAKLDRSNAGQGELRAQLIRLEAMLQQVIDGQAQLNRRLSALEERRLDAARVEELLLRVMGTPSPRLN